MDLRHATLPAISSARASKTPFTRHKLVRSLAALLFVLTLSLTSVQAAPVMAIDSAVIMNSTQRQAAPATMPVMGMMAANPHGMEGMMGANPHGMEGMLTDCHSAT